MPVQLNFSKTETWIHVSFGSPSWTTHGCSKDKYNLTVVSGRKFLLRFLKSVLNRSVEEH